jgi:hypothetical protein
MNRQFTIDPVTGARVIADSVEQIAQEFGRTVAAVQGIVDNLNVLYEVMSPLIEWLKATPADPSGQRPGAGLDRENAVRHHAAGATV